MIDGLYYLKYIRKGKHPIRIEHSDIGCYNIWSRKIIGGTQREYKILSVIEPILLSDLELLEQQIMEKLTC